MTDKQTDRLPCMDTTDRLTDNKTTNEREDEVVGIFSCRSRSPYVVAEVVVVEIVVVEYLQCMLIVVMSPELPGRPLMCSLVGG